MVSTANVRRLPGPLTDVWDWQLHSACRELDSAVFFHPDRERGPAKDERNRRAKAVCGQCPVIAECRRHAFAVQEPYGVWGGLTAAERLAMVRDPGLQAGQDDVENARAAAPSRTFSIRSR